MGKIFYSFGDRRPLKTKKKIKIWAFGKNCEIDIFSTQSWKKTLRGLPYLIKRMYFSIENRRNWTRGIFRRPPICKRTLKEKGHSYEKYFWKDSYSKLSLEDLLKTCWSLSIDNIFYTTPEGRGLFRDLSSCPLKVLLQA